MKIVFLASGTINSTLTYRILSFAKSLVITGNKVTIIAPSLDKYSRFKKEHFAEIDGVKILHPFQFYTKYRWLNLIPYMFHLIIITLTIKANIVHLYKPTPITAIGILFKLIRHIPLMVDMDDLGSKVMEQEKNIFVVSKIVSLCENLSLSNADGIICASSYLKRLYEKKYKTKIIWIPNGIEGNERTTMKRNRENVKLVVIGSLNRNSIVEPLIMVLPEVIRNLNQVSINVKILIFGEGQSSEYLKVLAQKNMVSDHINFKGWISKDEINNHVGFGDVGYAYMPDEETIKASSNLKLFQYMSMGIVPVVSDVGDLPFYVGEGKYGYIAKKNDLYSLTRILIEVLKNEKDRLEKAELCMDYVIANYSWNKLTMKIESFYKSYIS